MATLEEEVSRLLNPTPFFKDPEDISDDETRAQLVDIQKELEPEQISTSELRKKNISILSDIDKKYAGRRTSRKDLEQEEHAFSDDDSEDSTEGDNMSDENDVKDDKDDSDDLIGDSNVDDEESSSEEVSEDEKITDFKDKLKIHSTQKEFSFQDDGDYGKYGEDDEDDDDSEGDDDDLESVGSDIDSEEGDDEGKDNDEDNEEEIGSEDDAGIQKFSSASSDEIAKGKAAKQQLGLWDSLLEGRIKLQKAVSIINQLPQPDSWATFEEETEPFNEEAAKTQNVLKHILDSLVHLQDVLLYQNSETKHLTESGSKTKASSSKQQAPIDDDDEEIPSDSDEEIAENKADDKPDVNVRKRKLKMEDYPQFLAKRHTEFQDYRDLTIQRWNDKTQLSGGKIKGTFSAFEQSALKQINQILSDKERLIKRTQLKRSQYKILGKSVDDEKLAVSGEEEVLDLNPMNQDHLKDYDTEIFDDSDFYHQLLRELIEKKTSDINDPIALSRQWLEIQKLRGKTKKNVDTRASKGRKIRYDVHAKLVNFMAPVDNCDWSHEARDDLFKSLFGKRFASLT